jgi:methylmalonyl-CoA mutase
VNTYPNTTEKPLPAREIDYDAIAASRAKKTEQSRHSVEMDKVVLKPEASTVAHVRAALENGATFGDVLAKLREGQERYGFEAPEQRRLAEDYEDLRSASREAALNGKAPLVFQANIGPSRRYRARADWTSAFFHAAGFEVLNQDDFEGAETAANKLRETGAHIAVITADDETYAAHAEEVARGLKAASPNCFVILAGALDEAMTAKVKEAGVDEFVHLKVNNYEFNKMLLEKLGVL